MRPYHSHQLVVIQHMAGGMVNELEDRKERFADEIKYFEEYCMNGHDNEDIERLNKKMADIDNAIEALKKL